MTKKLEFSESVRIVQSALETIRQCEGLGPKDTLGELFPDENERENFRETVVKFVGAREYEIGAEKIPIHLYTTLGQIAQAVAMFALPDTLAHELHHKGSSGKSIKEVQLPPRPRKDIAFELPGKPSAPKSDDSEPGGPSKDDADEPKVEEQKQLHRIEKELHKESL
ncbi:MAG TPA: hypothetical protein VMU26_23095 [Candidatus Polarisedimenticolia bacterium]|nr:hypothetical protein [Candidatus Polarisedimenticolia bacterium]